MSKYHESDYEEAVIDCLREIGWDYAFGPDIDRGGDYTNPRLDDRLEAALKRINRKAAPAAVREALRTVRSVPAGPLEQRNAVFTDWLQGGVPVNYRENGERKADLVRLIDYDEPANNDFLAVNQWSVLGLAKRRFDLVLFVNGLPLAVCELKSPVSASADASAAYLQIRNYLHDVPEAFVPNVVCAISDQAVSKAGTITSPEDRFMEWKTEDGRRETEQVARYDVFFRGLFAPERLLDVARNFTCWSKDGGTGTKILAGYHQYFAVRKAAESTRRAVGGTRKAGVFWHTQGSGKSLSMVFYAHLLQTALEAPTIIVITDRNDLDDQLFGQFRKCADFLRQTAVQARSCRHLRDLVAGQKANGIFFTTMQKFLDYGEALSTRGNIVVMADEAHRSQYGLGERVKIEVDANGAETARTVQGIARLVRNAVPNATFIGFTGTPISTKDRSTVEVFGDCIDVYDMTQAVEDHAVCPIYYESRAVKLRLDKETLERIDREYDALAEEAEAGAIERSKRALATMDALLGSDETVDSFVEDVLQHYEENREHLLTGKAMIVAYSRPVAWKVYRKILEKRPEWPEGKVALVMTESNQDPEEWRKVVGDRRRREEAARRFKDDGSGLKIVVVVDMWLTGFDVPSLATMYLFKPMKEHNLMQAIARVNRVYKDKEGGLVVDYVGIAQALREAMAAYTRRDRSRLPEMDVSAKVYAQFRERLEICRDIFRKYDYRGFLEGTPKERADAISGGANFLLDPARRKAREDFAKTALGLRQALSLCASLTSRSERGHAAYFEAVRMLLRHLEDAGRGPRKTFSLREINDRINELLKHAVHSDGVLPVVEVSDEGRSLFEPEFLAKIGKMKSRNLAVEMLRRLVEDRIRAYKRTRLVKAGVFSERMAGVMNGYLNGQITNEQVIKELLAMAREMMEGDRNAEMSQEELAFYEAITKPEAVKDFYEHDVLVAMTKELTDQLRRNRTVDWQFRDDARAHMRMLVIRLLKKYKYPPEGMSSATDTVLKQCEIWADNPDFDEPPAEKPFRYADLYPEDPEILEAAEKPPRVHTTGTFGP